MKIRASLRAWREKHRKRRQKRWKYFLAIPHLFAKLIIIHCICVVTVAAYFSLFAQYRGADMTALFADIAASFISELAMLLLKTMLKKDAKAQNDPNFDNNEEDEDNESSSDEQGI